MRAGWTEAAAAVLLLVAVATLSRGTASVLLLGFAMYGAVSLASDVRTHLASRRR